VAHDIRDEVVDFITQWNIKTEITLRQIIHWIGLPRSKFYHWKKRYGKANEHNSWIPRDHWIEDWEKQAIIKYAREHPGHGYHASPS